MSKVSLKFYRSVIRDAWLPLVGRRRLTSTEYQYIEQLFDSPIEIDAVLKAIKRCRDRAISGGYTIFSLGVIRADIEAVMHKKSQTQVGGSAPVEDNAWRRQWRNDLEAMIDLVEEPFLTAYQALLGELDSLSREQAHIRWQEVQQLGKEPKQ